MLHYIIWDVNPEIFQLGVFPLRYYGLLFGTGILLCTFFLKKVYDRQGLSVAAFDHIFIYSFIGIFLGARLGHCLFYDLDYYMQHPLEVILPIQQDPQGNYQFTGFTGLASHGGAIGLLVALMLYANKYSIKFIQVLDMIGIVAPLGCAFIRLGNLMNSEMIGYPTDKPWTFVFRRIDDIPRHPAQLYEAIAYFLIFFLMSVMYQRSKLEIGKGMFFGTSITLMCLMRFLIEFLKEDQVAFESGMYINMGQVLSLPFMVIGLYFIVVAFRRTGSQ